MPQAVFISCFFNHYNFREKELIGYVKAKGYQTLYVTSDFDHNKKIHASLPYHENCMQITVPRYAKNLSLARLFSHWFFANRVGKKLKELHPDLIFCNFPPNSLIKIVIQYKRENPKVKVLFDCFDLWPESFPYPAFNWVFSVPFRLWRNLRASYINEADRVITISEKRKELLAKEVKIPEIVVLRPCQTKTPLKIAFQLPDDGISLLYLGNISFIIDMDFALRFLSRLRKERKVTLHIIGEGENKTFFVNRLESVGVRVFSHGVVYDEEKIISKIVSQCHFGLNIPRTSIQSQISLKSSDYLRFGLPILNTSDGDIFDMIKDNGAGINLTRELSVTEIERVLKVGSLEILEMQKNASLVFYRYFQSQSLDLIFNDVLPT